MSTISTLSSSSCIAPLSNHFAVGVWHSDVRRVQVGSTVCSIGENANTTSESKKLFEIPEGSNRLTGSRRGFMLKSSTAGIMLALFNFSGTRPSYIGVQKNPMSLALCPRTPNCISTSEELNDPGHYVPPWTYNPQDGRGRKTPVSQAKAMAELIEVVEKTKPENFTPRIVEKRDDYLYVEYVSPLPVLQFVDDVEFWFPPGDRSLVEYRSASRVGQNDFDANRKRIRALRKELEKKGWASIGF